MAIRATPTNFSRRTRRPVRQGPTELVLEIVRGRVKQRLRKLRGPVFLIGGAVDCDLVLGDQQFPDAYAYIFQRSDGISVRYLGGGPALEVDGELVETSPLKIGSRITAGPFEFVLTNDRGERDDENGDEDIPIISLRRDEDFSDPEGVDAVQALLREVRRLTAKDAHRGTGLARLGIVRRAS